MRWLILCALLSSCTSERDWRMVASTATIGYGSYGRGDISKGERSYDLNQGDEVWISIQPLAFLEPPKQVVVIQPEPAKPK